MAIIYEDIQIQWKLSKKCSIYTAEALVILKGFELTTNKIIILSNSLSSLISLQNQWKPTNIARKIQNTHIRASFTGKLISYM